MSDESERRGKLLALKDTVRAFFEVTNVTPGGRGWSNAFQAVRQNDYMADSFLVELRALIDFIEVEFDPLFGKRGGSDKTPTTDEHPADTLTPSVASVNQALALARREVQGKTPVVPRAPEKPPAPKAPVAPPKAPPAVAKPAPVAAKPAPAPAKPAPAPPRPSPILERAASKRPVAPPPPPPRRNQFADSETRVDTAPQFVDEDATDATGRMIMPPLHIPAPPSPPKKRK
jgi:hypothetical protein